MIAESTPASDLHWVVFTRRPDGGYSISEIFQMKAQLDRLFPDSMIDNEDFGMPGKQEKL